MFLENLVVLKTRLKRKTKGGKKKKKDGKLRQGESLEGNQRCQGKSQQQTGHS